MKNTFSQWTRIAPLLVLASLAYGENPYDAPECPIADAEPRTAGFFEVGLISRQRVQGDNQGTFGMVETRGAAEVAYFYGSAGPFWMTGIVNLWMPIGGELADLPYQLGQLAILAQGDYRTWSGLTVRGELQPGIYSDLTTVNDRALAFPFGLHLIQAINPDVALQGGVRVTPGFNRRFDPVLGVRMKTRDFQIDLFYPESSLLWQVGPDLTFLAQAAIRREYDFHINDPERNHRFRMKENRVTLGGDYALADNLLLMLRAGLIFDRGIAFKTNDIQSKDVDDAIFFSVGAGVTF